MLIPSSLSVVGKIALPNVGAKAYLVRDAETLTGVKKAVGVYKNKELWYKLLLNGLSYDFSWDSSAEKYGRLYNKLINTP